MLLNRETLPQDHVYLIRGYGEGYIDINQERFRQSLILSPKVLHRHWEPCQTGDLSIESFSIALQLDPAILLIGTGPSGTFLTPSLLAEIMGQHIGVDVMDTPSACRTYNILAADGRSVVAALLMP
ncbi:MAG: Mth938-like domain-containing protein [Gammaproteobacteria bacterium]